MPLDPSIPLQTRGVQIKSPMDSYTRMQRLKNYSLQGQEAQMQVDKIKQEEEARAADPGHRSLLTGAGKHRPSDLQGRQ